MVNKRVAIRVGIKLDKMQTVSIAPAVGNVTQVPLASVSVLNVGSRSTKNLLVTISDFAKSMRFHGLLGMNFLERFRFTIEPDTATLILRDIPKS
ncbi:MAG: retroviral-like aspartic protease family protein [bacterium]